MLDGAKLPKPPRFADPRRESLAQAWLHAAREAEACMAQLDHCMDRSGPFAVLPALTCDACSHASGALYLAGREQEAIEKEIAREYRCECGEPQTPLSPRCRRCEAAVCEGCGCGLEDHELGAGLCQDCVGRVRLAAAR